MYELARVSTEFGLRIIEVTKNAVGWVFELHVLIVLECVFALLESLEELQRPFSMIIDVFNDG